MKGICLKPWQIKALQTGKLKEILVPLKFQPIDVLPMKGDLRGVEWIGLMQKEPPKSLFFGCRHGKSSDRLFVKETFAIGNPKHYWGSPIYKATFGAMLKPICEGFTPWKSSIIMPQRASRLTLEIEKVSAIQVQNVTEKQAKAMGFEWDERPEYYADGTLSRNIYFLNPVQCFIEQWDIDHKPPLQWRYNPWCWSLRVKLIK